MKLRVIPFLIVGLFFYACSTSPPHAQFQALNTPEILEQKSTEFEKAIIEVTEGVHVAIGYGLANSILIEGDESCVLIDTLESVEAASVLRQDLALVTPKPIEAIIYTHHHGDHVFGAAAFRDEDHSPAVYAHETTARYIAEYLGMLHPEISRRTTRMYGTYLDTTALINCGIGSQLRLEANSEIDALPATVTFADQLDVRLAGLDLELYHAPGESEDQLYIWLPAKRTLFCGDNFYSAFPNLAPIQGTPYHDVMRWVDSLDRMRYRRPLHLIPSHGRPISGEQDIFESLTDYRDAIQFVHDQTLRGINEGYSPDELVNLVKLPTHLQNSPHLRELFGSVAWSVRGIYQGYLGWFDGNPTSLDPLPPVERAMNMVQLAGGEAALLQRVREALGNRDPRWALELTDHLLTLQPGHREARLLRAEALTTLGEAEANPNARHYYLTRAAELGQGLQIGNLARPGEEMLTHMSTLGYFKMLSVNLDADKARDTNKKVGFIFTDTGEEMTLHVRRGVAEIQPMLLPQRDMTVTTTAAAWKAMVARRRGASVFIAKDVQVDVGAVAFTHFMGLFDLARMNHGNL